MSTSSISPLPPKLPCSASASFCGAREHVLVLKRFVEPSGLNVASLLFSLVSTSAQPSAAFTLYAA